MINKDDAERSFNLKPAVDILAFRKIKMISLHKCSCYKWKTCLLRKTQGSNKDQNTKSSLDATRQAQGVTICCNILK